MIENNTITLLAYDRPHYFRQVVASINQNSPELACFKVFCFTDSTGQVGSINDELKKLETSFELHVVSGKRTTDQITRFALEYVWQQGSKFNLHIEDDCPLSPDALRLALWFKAQTGYVALEMFARNRDQLASQSQIVEHPTFNAWGWACFRWAYEKYLHEGFDTSKGCYDLAMHDVMRKYSLKALRPRLSRSKNIGAIGVRTTSEYYNEHLTGFNFNDKKYTGVYEIVP
jgi:hypothetical protein